MQGRKRTARRRVLIDLGRVRSVVKTGHIIVDLNVKSIKVNKIVGSRVYVRTTNKAIGVLADIIGNVEKPYGVVKPISRDYLNEVSPGESLYIIFKKDSGGPRGRFKKRRGKAFDKRNA